MSAESGAATSVGTWDAFEQGASAWEAYCRSPHGRMREALIQQRLHEHLEGRPLSLTVLDVGCGTGGYSLGLALEGCQVLLVDYAPAMLSIARDRFTVSAPDALARAEFRCSSASQLPPEISGRRFDLLLVHTLLEYLPDPWRTLERLASLMAPDGMISLVIANEHSDALRLGGARHDPEGAIGALRGETPAWGLFDAGRRLLSLERCRETLEEQGVDIVGHYGVRIFAESYTADELADEQVYESVMALEREAAGREPYRQIGRYHHLLGIRRR